MCRESDCRLFQSRVSGGEQASGVELRCTLVKQTADHKGLTIQGDCPLAEYDRVTSAPRPAGE